MGLWPGFKKPLTQETPVPGTAHKHIWRCGFEIQASLLSHHSRTLLHHTAKPESQTLWCHRQLQSPSLATHRTDTHTPTRTGRLLCCLCAQSVCVFADRKHHRGQHCATLHIHTHLLLKPWLQNNHHTTPPWARVAHIGRAVTHSTPPVQLHIASAHTKGNNVPASHNSCNCRPRPAPHTPASCCWAAR